MSAASVSTAAANVVIDPSWIVPAGVSPDDRVELVRRARHKDAFNA